MPHALDKWAAHMERQAAERAAQLSAADSCGANDLPAADAYRRGYYDGVAKTLDAILAGATLGGCTKWLERLAFWRDSTKPDGPPPQP